MRSRIRAVCFGLVFAGLSPSPALHAQVATGNIRGTVVDASDAVIPAVKITLTNADTGFARVVASNEQGDFSAQSMPLGNYQLIAEYPGFQKKVISGLSLRVDQTAVIRIVLEPGAVTQTVEVTGATPLLESQTSSLGQVIENKKILELPLNGRNPFALGLLAGNTTPMAGMGSNLPFIGGGGRFSANEVMIDGVDNNTVVNRGSIGRSGIAYVPSVDAVQEFKVKTGTFSAEFGHAAGAVINATIKSGSNDFHGTLFEFLRNDKLDANNFFTNAAGRPKAKFRQNQFGGALGGRLFRNQTFFFMDYQGTRQRTAASSSFSDVPPEDFRRGDFSRLGAQIFDPATRRLGPAGAVIATPFASNRIPADRMNPTSVAITGLVPSPNFGEPGAQSRNYFRQAARRFNGDQWDVRVDHNLSSSNNLFGRFSFGNEVRPSPGRFEGFIGGGSSGVDFARHAVLSDTHVFTPRTVNEFRFGYIRRNGSIVGDAPKGVEFAQQHRLALFPFPIQGFPSIGFNFSGIPSGSQQFSAWGGGNPNLNFENRFQWADNVNMNRGSHTLKIGADVRRTRFDYQKGAPFFGEFIFGSIFTSSSDVPGSGAPLADFLLGFPSTVQGTQMLDWGRQREIYFSSYVQDDWKATRKLTLNLGLRYDLFTQPVDARDRGSLFDVTTGRFAIPGKDGYTRALVDGDHNNIGPRAGFAYQATGKFVIRGGYGIFYGLRDQNQQVTAFAENNPNTPAITVPAISARTTVAPPFTINTPITVAPSDVDLTSFTAANPLVRTLRSQGFKDARNPMLHQFNVSFQYEPRASWLMELSLSGARGRDLASGWINMNQVPFERILAGPVLQRDRPFPHINGTVIPSRSIAKSSYHAANFKLEKRYSAGLNFLLNYTVQKNLEKFGTGPSAFEQNGGTSLLLDTYNLERERAHAPIDVPQIFVVSYGYELPWGPGKRWLGGHGAVSRILGGWQVNGITVMRGGFPSDIRTNVLPGIFNTFNVPDRVKGEPIQVKNNRGPDSFFNPAAFRVPGAVRSATGAAVTLLGDSARRVARGPGSVNFDFSVFKEAVITERYRVQFRAEFFNLTNTPTFFLPSASDPALTCIARAPGGPCNEANAGFGKLSNGTATGRQIQLGLKLMF